MPEDETVAAGQEAAVAALQSGRAVGEARSLRRIDTHISHLFLGRERAYKLKRAVRLPFADFSTLEARRRACEAELAVNRPLAPSLYLGVEALARAPEGSLRLGGPGETVDWLVVMRRFADGALFSEMADEGRLSPALVAETVARFHAALPSTELAGHAADYRHTLDDLKRTEAEAAAALGLEAGAQALFEALERALARQSPLIEARRRAGRVRRGHGDLHLANLCLFEGRVTPFDALEFDPALATTDVLYDLAFLLMDLHARGLAAFANLAMNRYWDAAGEPEAALALLPPFMALRAAVRMAVATVAGDLDEAARYRRLGLELLHPHPVRLVAVGGLSGTGKSTLAAAIAFGLSGPCGARLVRSDVIRKQAAGVAVSIRLGQDAYAPAARGAVYARLAEAARAVLDAGSSAIADATFREASARSAIEAAAGSHAFAGLWLTAPTAVRLARVGTRTNDASDATTAVAAEQHETEPLGSNWRSLDASGSSESLADAARRSLGVSSAD